MALIKHSFTKFDMTLSVIYDSKLRVILFHFDSQNSQGLKEEDDYIRVHHTSAKGIILSPRDDFDNYSNCLYNYKSVRPSTEHKKVKIGDRFCFEFVCLTERKKESNNPIAYFGVECRRNKLKLL